MDDNTKEKRPDSRATNELHARYGKIGISAVAAAVRPQPKPEQRQPANKTRFVSEHD